MRIFVIGGQGMAGHIIINYLRRKLTNDLFYSTREQSADPNAFTLDLTEEKSVYEVLKSINPDFVINAAGILNDDTSKRLEEAILVNSLVPHRLASYADQLGYRLIHISTDCVFSGLRGRYKEDEITDGTSIYAKTKSLGEVTGSKHVTIRTSIIGPELRKNGIGLFQWFMNQTGIIPGYQHVFWNGVTTIELAKAISWIIHHDIDGLVHLTGNRDISKYDLLFLFKETFQKEDIQIIPNKNVKNNKTLVNSRVDFSYKGPDYQPMMQELKEWMQENRELYSHYKF